MNKTLTYAIVVLVFCIFSGLESQENLQDFSLNAGVASVSMCPPVGVPLAGYGGGKRRLEFPDLDPDNYHVLLAPSDGILDTLVAKALVLESNGVKIAILKLDSIGVMDHMVEDIAKKITSTGIDRDHLTIVGTHTHSGPGAMCKAEFWAVAAVDLMDKRIYNPLMDKLAALIISANANLTPARLGVGTGLGFDLSRNRRNHPGLLDPVIGVFKIEKNDGTPLAVLFNFAIHGTCLGANSLKMSGDVMGFAERYIENVMPTCAMFVNGTEGDVAPAKGGYDGAKLVGEALGARVVELLPTIATNSQVPIYVANCEIVFSKAHLNVDLLGGDVSREESQILDLFQYSLDMRLKIKIEITGMVPLKFRLQAVRVGDVVIGCIPGEPLTRVGTVLKTSGGNTGFAHTFVFGLANGHMGYICDKDSFDEGGYEAMMNIYGRDAVDRIVENFNQMFAQLKNR